MHVILVAPHFPANQRQFARALKQAGAYVTGIGEANVNHIDGELRGWLDAYEQVPSVVHEDSLLNAVRRIQRRGWVDRLEATIEAHIIPTANVREQTGIPGLSTRNAFLCRDKPEMKAFLRDHGIPCAQSDGVETVAQARAFAGRVGYPVILKPRAAAGAKDTSRVDDDEELEREGRAMGLDRGGSIGIEEFIEGHEGFYDTLTITGEVQVEFVSHYYPGVLEAMRDRSIQPYLLTTNRIHAPGYSELKKLGRNVISAMGLGTTATHMEWFFGPKGLKFSEIGARPPGVGTWDLYCAANGFDLYRQWANAIVHGKIDDQPSRQFAAGMIALRPDRDGHVAGYEGADVVQRQLGKWIIDAYLPPVGARTQPIEAGYMANAWLRMRHPDYDTLRQMLEYVGQTLRVRAR
jgi:carbamoylphosphate synthase large subunit